MAFKLTRSGYDEYVAEIKKKEEELKELGIFKGKVAVEQGDVWHDNHTFEQAEIQERMLKRTIADMKEKLKNVEIIEERVSEGVVEVGSTVEVELNSPEDDEPEILTITISGHDKKNNNSSVISVNSPLANVIMNKAVGYIGEYEVADLKIKVKIKKIY